MKITYLDSYESMSRKAGEILVTEISNQKNLLLCAATGRSPLEVYRELVSRLQNRQGSNKHLRVIKLDEWGGLPQKHPVTCEYFIRKHLIEPLAIPEENYISFSSDPPDPMEECNRIRMELETRGPIDLCILGLGTNGHLGLNEPGSFLEPYCHVAELSEQSLEHQMIDTLAQKPGYGLTLGMTELLSSKKIVLLITGKNKREVIHRLLTKEITSELPASLLWLHQDVECLIDQTSLE